MRVDELIFSKRECLKELQSLCRKWNIKIEGCSFMNYAKIVFSDGCEISNIYVDGKRLDGTIRVELVKDDDECE